MTFWTLSATLLCLGIGACVATPARAALTQDAARKLVTLTDEQGHLSLRLNYGNQCILDQVVVNGRQVISPDGVNSGVLVGGEWRTTRKGIRSPQAVVRNNTLTVKNIIFGVAGSEVSETWVFIVRANHILWRISRSYPQKVVLEDAAFPAWNFGSMTTWTGGILDTGGVVWNKYLESPNATYGAHAGAVTFWNREKNDCLRIVPTLDPGLFSAVRFSHQPKPGGAELNFNTSVSREELRPKHNLNRFLGDRQDLWSPVTQSGEQSVEFSLQALDYAKTYDRGTFKGVDGGSIRELMNTVGRYGVIDKQLMGGNGWRSGYICLHEQWFAQIGMVLNDPNYNANYAATLDNFRDNAIQPDGRVLSRWKYDAGDAMPGTYTSKGFYEAQWGFLMDSQTDYVINVAEQFNLSGDRKWLAGQQVSCERALDYLLRREVGNTGIVAMMTDSRQQQKGSDWFDIVWASHQNALVNAELFYALTLWAQSEDALGNPERAKTYRAFAARLKTSFNRPIEQGGFWDPANKWYVYWRDKDGSVHGNNLFTAVNFCAISYGLCDDRERQIAVLDRIEAEMQKEKLFHWPTNFWPFAPDEVGGGNLPFPRYENGDIFMSWGEVGVRAYAAYDPALALKYIKNVLAKYEEDGLSFQRYERQNQKGAGDDILAGNCMAVVGLYRNIYGLQPRFNRLYLEPHMVPELNGTRLNYELRGQKYQIALDTSGSAITANRCTVRAASPFGVNATAKGIEYFPRQSQKWGLSLTPLDSRPAEIQIENWPDNPDSPRKWKEISAPSTAKRRYDVASLRPGAVYELRINGKKPSLLRADANGLVTFVSSSKVGVAQGFELRFKR